MLEDFSKNYLVKEKTGSSSSLLLVMWRLEVVRSCEGGSNKIVSKVGQQFFQVPSSICLLLLLGKFERFHSMSFFFFPFFPTLALLLLFSIICVRRTQPHLEV